jgi:glycosyltransferase involved in cell wall biosynthesis
MTSKEICIIVETESFGGAENHTGELVKFLLSNGHLVELVSCNNSFYDQIARIINHDNLTYTKVETSTTRKSPGFSRKWTKILSSLRSSILILPKGWFWSGNIEFLKLCRKKFNKIYYIEHLTPEDMPPMTSKKYLGGIVSGAGIWWHLEKHKRARRSLFADRVVAVSGIVGKKLISECGYPADKVFPVNNGVDSERFVHDEETARKFREKINVDRDAFVIGVLARLVNVKGVDVALKSFQKLAEQKIDRKIYFVIAGDGEESENLKRLSRELGIDKQVIFLGFIENPLEILSGYDVILFPSRNEGLPLALLEAMSCGCVPVVTDAGGMPDVVHGSAAGWVVKKDNAADLSVALAAAAKLGRNDFENMRKKARDHVKQNYNAARTYREILDVFNLERKVGPDADYHGKDRAPRGLNLVHVCQTYHPAKGGNSVHLKELSEGLVGQGDRVTVFTTNLLDSFEFYRPEVKTELKGEEIINGVRVKRYGMNHCFYKFFFKTLPKISFGYRLSRFLLGERYEMLRTGPICWKMTRDIIQFRPDAILVMNAACAHLYFAYLARKILRCPFVVIPTIHTQEDWAKMPLMFRILRSADKVIALTSSEKDFLVSHGVRPEKIEVEGVATNYNCPAFGELPDKKQKQELKEKYGVRDCEVITFVGRIVEGKGAGNLVQAMRPVWKACPRARLLIAGAKTKYYQKLEAMIEALPPEDREKIILKFDFADDEKKQIYALSDIFAMPSTVDSFGLVYLEAWAFQVPVIACSKTPQATFIEDGINGLLVDHNDNESLARAIIALCRDENLRIKLGKAGREKVCRLYSWDGIVNNLRDEYARLLGAR